MVVACFSLIPVTAILLLIQWVLKNRYFVTKLIFLEAEKLITIDYYSLGKFSTLTCPQDQVIVQLKQNNHVRNTKFCLYFIFKNKRINVEQNQGFLSQEDYWSMEMLWVIYSYCKYYFHGETLIKLDLADEKDYVWNRDLFENKDVHFFCKTKTSDFLKELREFRKNTF